MMYRSGWAKKANQERILAFRLKREGFEELLENAVITSHSNQADETWKQAIKEAQVVLQWDPDHTPNGDKVTTRRAIQLGIRGELLLKFSHSFIVDVYDITDFVNEQFNRCLVQEKPFQDLSGLEIPAEKCYFPKNEQISKHIDLTA